MVTILMSFILGQKIKKVFVYEECIKLKESYVPIIVLGIGYAIEFANETIPLIAIIKGNINYGDFTGMPILHVVITAGSIFYAIQYFYYALCNSNKRRFYLANYTIIILYILLTFTRSTILFIFSISALMLIAKLKKEHNFSRKQKVGMGFGVVLVLYAFGGFGNLRQGFGWNDSSYISGAGRFRFWPSFIPEQFKWAYLYLVTPLANLNYNVKIGNNGFKLNGLLSELLPRTITKRIIHMDMASAELVVNHFNVSTGWCGVYIQSGFIGMIILYIYALIMGLIGVKLSQSSRNVHLRVPFLSLYCAVIMYMFFVNTFVSVGFSFVLWVYILLMIFNKYNFLKFKKYQFNLIGRKNINNDSIGFNCNCNI
jgi:hypothetical protein